MQRLCDIRRLLINRKMGKVGHRVADLVEPNSVLTLNPDFVAGEFDNKKTLFKEIEVVPIKRALNLDAIERMAKHTFKQVPIGKADFVQQFIELFEQSVDSLWDAGKAHLVLHSSGYDSRVLSKTIANLMQRHGRQWLGRTFFVCMSPEHDYFDAILDYLGFDDSYRVYYFRDYETTINFQDGWRNVNGTASYPDNAPMLAIKFARKIKNIFGDDEDIQIFSAGFFNETWDYGFFSYIQNIHLLVRYRLVYDPIRHKLILNLIIVYKCPCSIF